MPLNPYNPIIRPNATQVPGLRGGGLLIVFDDDDRPVLPQFKPESAGEVRKVSWFTRSDDGREWWWRGDEGCSDEWLGTHPGFGLGDPEVPDRLVGLTVRVITWTPARDVLRDVQVVTP